jgi:hypothetical protein
MDSLNPMKQNKRDLLRHGAGRAASATLTGTGKIVATAAAASAVSMAILVPLAKYMERQARH